MKEVNDRNPRDNHGQTPLHLAAKNGHLKVCKTIIKEADDKNPKDNRGMTPFHIAALMGHEKICKLFMSSVDDYNPKTVDGRTPISCAAQNDHSGTVKLDFKELLIKEQSDFKERFTDYQLFYTINLLLNKELLPN